MIAAVEYSRRHLTFWIVIDAGLNVIDGELAGNLAVLAAAVEGVIADAFVTAQLLVVGGRAAGAR
ncbi:Uncharacterised protein [Mycobacterium xenopi]|uniref:Uncharacterized protein n=1 Tax=Mycobacterium xenopi TaxID=1789 RepID=A0AAD1M078_MYCXE|nr:hypothetical protein MYXE_09450 [Mycobacterium xenopi]SPX78947.1 Uncharacterised protein [Mycobacterium xenopi]